MRREEREKTERDEVWREAAEKYMREYEEWHTREDLVRELREVRGEIAEVKSVMKPREQDAAFLQPYTGPEFSKAGATIGAPTKPGQQSYRPSQAPSRPAVHHSGRLSSPVSVIF
ncbi:hypothetical protein PG997_007472 [Apiospora hydei]|uniref:Uncharacterized protein n=1 Tax=Apiospora hydei TaxID=1337664 RepID=A0ABR1WBW2_9PEZI